MDATNTEETQQHAYKRIWEGVREKAQKGLEEEGVGNYLIIINYKIEN